MAVFDPAEDPETRDKVAAAEAVIEKENKKKEEELPPFQFGDELEATEPEIPEELIAGILHQGAKMVLGGGSKSFKTWCLADLALCISQGRPWWGRTTKAGIVVYLNFEVQKGFFHDRLRSICKARSIVMNRNLIVWNLRGFSADHAILLPKLAERLKGMNIVAIVLDPTYKIMAGSENAQEEVAALMNSIERLGIATGAAVIFGSHFAKGNAAGKDSIDRISGSGVFARDPDAILTMTKHEEDEVFVIEPTLRNCPPVEPFAVRWRFPLMVPEEGVDVSALRQPGNSSPTVYSTKDAMEVLPSGLVTRADWVRAGAALGIKKSRMYELIKGCEKARLVVVRSGLFTRKEAIKINNQHND